MFAGGDEPWAVVTLRPGGRPFEALSRSVLRALSNAHPSSGEVASLEAVLRRGPGSLVDVYRSSHWCDVANLLVLVDQFEELLPDLSTRADLPSRYDAHDAAERFINLLASSVEQEDAPIYVGLTMRSDQLGKCEPFVHLSQLLSESQVLVPRLTRAQCQRAIERPASVFASFVESTVVTELLNALDPSADQLPVLQHALMRMWEAAGIREHIPSDEPYKPRQLTRADLLAIGGLQGALYRHAEEAYSELTDADKRVAEQVFRRLTRPPDLRDRASLREVAQFASISTSALNNVIEVFSRDDRNFLTIRGPIDDPDSTLDISHESLIRQWRRKEGSTDHMALGDWVVDEAESAASYRYLLKSEENFRRGTGNLWRGRQLLSAYRLGIESPSRKGWALRYGTLAEYEKAIAFIRRSRRAARRDLVFVAILAVLVAAGGIAGVVVNRSAYARYRIQVSKDSIETLARDSIAAAQNAFNEQLRLKNDTLASAAIALAKERIALQQSNAQLNTKNRTLDSTYGALNTLQVQQLVSNGMNLDRAQNWGVHPTNLALIIAASRAIDGSPKPRGNAPLVRYYANAVDSAKLSERLRADGYRVEPIVGGPHADSLYVVEWGRYVSRDHVKRVALTFVRAGLRVAIAERPLSGTNESALIRLDTVSGRTDSPRSIAWSVDRIAMWTGGNDPFAFLRIGTRPGESSDFFVNGVRYGRIDSLSIVPVPAGQLQLRLSRGACSWSTPIGSPIDAAPGDTINLGYRRVTC
jgi:hypothetical protein